MKTLQLVTLFLLSLTFSTSHAAPTNFSFTGNFSGDDDVAFFNFSVVGVASTVGLQTFGYGGGTNAAGTAIAAGGFDPILSLYDAAGNGIIQNDDNGGAVDPNTGAAFDSLINILLNPGDYVLALTQFSNFGPLNLADPFPGSGRINFVDVTGSARTSFFALDIRNVETAVAAVPEPAQLWLFGIGLLGLGMIRRRRSAS